MAPRAGPRARSLPRLAFAALAAHHVWLWLTVVTGVVVVGALGYVVLGWGLSDAMYMTVISLTTVGYREVRELDDVGRAWTALVAVSGVGVIFGSIGIVVESLVGEVTSGKREARRMAADIERLRGHFVLCGYGRVGSTVANKLVSSGQQVVVIDVNEASLVRARADGHLVVAGDA
ncbi:MAG: potassium channel protein, partial [Chloroflexi bacterium]|nr:potassium channel protein [Chloroflexota bacterium]